ncbi:MAG: hypothetical protein QM785_02600 [Pyrinomonadaceae bacterium]
MKFFRQISIVAMITIFVATIAATPFDQPFMQAALNDLKEAQNHLKNATADKGGNRQRAMDFTAGAITAVNKGIDYDRTHITPRPGRRNSTDVEALPASPDQPNMEKARESLKNALANLRKASADKGGYREQAMAMTNNAINSVNAGIQYDRTH